MSSQNDALEVVFNEKSKKEIDLYNKRTDVNLNGRKFDPVFTKIILQATETISELHHSLHTTNDAVFYVQRYFTGKTPKELFIQKQSVHTGL